VVKINTKLTPEASVIYGTVVWEEKVQRKLKASEVYRMHVGYYEARLPKFTEIREVLRVSNSISGIEG
jgi:hypothetical protein